MPPARSASSSLMRRSWRVVDERPQQRHRDRLDAVGEQAVDRGDHLVLLERDDHVAVAVDALGDAADQRARHDRVGFAQPRGVDEVALGEPGDLRVDLADDDRVLVAPGRDQAGARAGAGQHRVGRLRRAVHEQVGRGEQLPGASGRAARR